jgi:hypothetical protein
MNANIFKAIFLGFSSFFMVLREGCADDWKMVDHYQVKGGLAKDLKTGLIWMRCSFGQKWDGATCQGESANFKWEQAMNIPKHFDYAGYGDWRMPTREELKILIFCSSGKTKKNKTETYDDGRSECDGNYSRPTINTTIFPETSAASFWSSSMNANDGIWGVDFVFGSDGVYWKDGINQVRLVRSGGDNDD